MSGGSAAVIVTCSSLKGHPGLFPQQLWLGFQIFPYAASSFFKWFLTQSLHMCVQTKVGLF